ncbi:MAG TPA: alpha-L-fucosidase [Vicinamibacterales bacterium]|nr:alpha-L-fucosidase [Vicinamibacterales bacterium]
MRRLAVPCVLAALALAVPAAARAQAPSAAPSAAQLAAQLPAETPQQKEARLQWWTDARFGMFIHWGLYALPARHEWVKKYERISDADYQKYFDQFDPDLYDPREWARQAKQAGMKYAVITSKHHEGFCLFDSKYTDYKATRTPAKRDLIKAFVEAFRAEGLKVGFYYSLLDWHHPSYTVDRNHPQSGSTDAEYAALNAGRDMDVYRQYVKDQVRELLTNYGAIDIIWLDFSFAGGAHGKGRSDWDSVNLLKMVRELQPGIIVNDRLDLDDVPGGWDFRTPEQFKPRGWVMVNGQRVPWETCQTFSGSWGYHRDEATWKSPAQLIELLVDTVSKGGNLLMNVGPTARGTFDQRAKDRLAAFGRWTQANGRSIYGATQAPPEFKAPPNTLLTYNPATKRLYVHVLAWPMGDIVLEGYAGKVAYAQLLHDASEVRLSERRATIWMDEAGKTGDLVMRLPMLKPDVEIPVVELVLK